MKILLITLCFIFTPKLFGQNAEFCNPQFAVDLSKEITENLSNKVLRELKKQPVFREDEWWKINKVHIFNFEDFIPILDYAKERGIDAIPDYQIEQIISEYIFHSIKGKSRCLSAIMDPYLYKIEKKNQTRLRLSVKDSIDGIYIPINLEDCLLQLDGFWSIEEKEKSRTMSLNSFKANSHFGIGIWMRNNWGLWAGSRLHKYFTELGITHPDDMSGIIIHSFYNYLNNKPINLEEQIDFYKRYWLIIGKPKKNEFPKQVKDVEWYQSVGYEEYENQEISPSLHFYADINKLHYWINDYNFGWKKITTKDIKEFDNLKTDADVLIWLKKIYKVN